MNEYCVLVWITVGIVYLLYDHLTDTLLLLLIQDSPVQLHPGSPYNEHAHHEGDDQLDDEDDPAGQHVVTVGHNLLHAEISTNQNTVLLTNEVSPSESGADVDIECLSWHEPNHAGQDVAMCGQTGDREHSILETKGDGCQPGQYDQLECLLTRNDIVQRPDVV